MEGVQYTCPYRQWKGGFMARARKGQLGLPNNGAKLGFEAQMWQAADALRGGMDAAEYKHVVLGLIFLKYISDAFEEQHAKLEAERSDGADPEDPDEYRALNIFWVPPEARWSHLKAQAKQPTIGELVDDAMAGVERDNVSLKGVLPKDYARPNLDKVRLGQLIDLITNIQVGDAGSRSKDVLGRVYEYFLAQFASAEGKNAGEFYTPRSIVRLLVEMLEPYKGRVYDPCCGSAGMFVQSEAFVRAHGGKLGDISIYGQESNYTTWRLALMNLAIRGIDAHIAHGDSFHNDRHPDLKADFILANPPFNDSDWNGQLLRQDKRWEFGVPPVGNANFAWVQHFIHHLAPGGGAGFVLANGSMSSNQSGEGEIRKAIVEANLVDCMVALPGQLFYSTPIPVCLWFLSRDRTNHRFRNRHDEVLFIDARGLGDLVDRTHRELKDEDIARVAQAYHAWRGESEAGAYEDVPGFCKSATFDELRSQGYVLTPGRYVGTEVVDNEDLPFAERVGRLSGLLGEQIRESRKLDAEIEVKLGELGLSVRVD
jgi:type I restriction enzyme M protein